MARLHLALLPALAALLLAAAPAALAVEKPPFTIEDLGTGAPKAANCNASEAGPLGGNWVEMTQVGARRRRRRLGRHIPPPRPTRAAR